MTADLPLKERLLLPASVILDRLRVLPKFILISSVAMLPLLILILLLQRELMANAAFAKKERITVLTNSVSVFTLDDVVYSTNGRQSYDCINRCMKR